MPAYLQRTIITAINCGKLIGNLINGQMLSVRCGVLFNIYKAFNFDQYWSASGVWFACMIVCGSILMSGVLHTQCAYIQTCIHMGFYMCNKLSPLTSRGNGTSFQMVDETKLLNYTVTCLSCALQFVARCGLLQVSRREWHGQRQQPLVTGIGVPLQCIQSHA